MTTISTVTMHDGKEDQDEADFAIQPAATGPAVDPSNWPLLLKDWDKRTCVLLQHINSPVH